MTNKNSRAGFTLLEILLYTGIAATILGSVAALFLLTLSARVKFQTMTEVQEQGARAVQIITQKLRNASAITAPLPQAESSSLTFTSKDGNGEHTATIAIANGIITLTEDSGSSEPLTSANLIASELTFRNLSISPHPGSIAMDFILNYNALSERQEYNYSQHFYGSATIR